MKKLLLITGLFLAIITSLLVQCQKDGLHPNFPMYFLVIVPCVLIFAAANGSILDSSKKIKQ